ncbi:MAG: hypothetical protein KY462_11435 [Actinobacteria bacterium]|nr:hypothetical protein [Actinomycetota bacterium]
MEQRYIDEWQLRRLFNEGEFYERMLGGELSAMKVDENRPSKAANQPAGTRSEEWLYDEGATVVARVHQYVLPDGTIGASGRPDRRLSSLMG